MPRSRLLALTSLFLAAACGSADPPAAPAPPPIAHALVDLPIDAPELDARPPDARDDRAYLQGLIDATPDGGLLTIPPGAYVVTRWSTSDWALRVTRPMTIRGPGVVIAQAPGTGPSVRLLHVDAPDVTVMTLELDGRAADQVADEHRAGVFVTRERVRLVDLVAHDFTGDGVYLYANVTTGLGANDAELTDVTLVDNRRNGVTMGGWSLARIAIRGGTFARNGAQQIDSEPGTGATVDDVSVTDAMIDPGASTDYAITVSGTSSAARSARWRVVGNTITRGGIFVVWTDDVVVAGNTITSTSAKPCVYVYRTNTRTTVAHNICAMTDAAASFPSGVAAIGTGSTPTSTGGADALTIVDNDITVASPTGLGVRVQGAVAAAVVGNTLHGSGVINLGGSAVYVRPTDQAVPMREAVVVGNTGTRFGKRGLSVAGNVTARLLQLTVVANTFGDAGAVQDVGCYLDDGTHPVVRSTIVEQHYGTGVTSGRVGEALP